MIEGDDPSHRFLPRIHQELDKLPINAEQRDTIARSLLENASFLDSQGTAGRSGCLSEHSSFFDLESKVRSVVSAFEDDGLTYSDYLGAVVRVPALLDHSPDTLISRINTVVDGLSEDGLTRRSYLKAAMKFPTLFWATPDKVLENVRGTVNRLADEGLTTQAYLKAALAHPSVLVTSPATIERNIRQSAERLALSVEAYLKTATKNAAVLWTPPERVESNIRGVVELLGEQGITHSEYVKAALKQPALFGALPETVVKNVTGLVDRFAQDGLTLRQYLWAALKQPSLFQTTPDTISSHITGVVDRYRADGMTTREYLNAALKHPSLFTMSPETICRHIDTVLDFAERGIFRPPVPRRADHRIGPFQDSSRAAVIDFLLRQPALMALADENYGVREVHQRLTNGPTDRKVLETPRHTVERELMAHLGHDDPSQPVETDGFVAGAARPTEEQARRFLLRALMHAGYIKGGSMER